MTYTRRNFLSASTSLIAGIHARAFASNASLTPVSTIQTFGTGALRCECLVIDKANNVYGAGHNGIIYHVTAQGAVRELGKLPAGATPSGVTMDRQDNIICCDSGTHCLYRISSAGDVSVITRRVGDVDLTTPNFPTYDAKGTLFITNSTHLPDDATAVKEGEFNTAQPNGSLVCIHPDGSDEVVARGLYWANGTAIDPREEAIYVLQSTMRNCLRIPLKGNGRYGKIEIYSDHFPGMPDGMAFAEDGTLFVTVPVSMGPQVRLLNQVIKIERNGRWSLFCEDADGLKLALPTNCAFGGPDRRTLYVANSQGDHFCRIPTSYVGHRLYHQR